ncbi:MAG: M3 family oligoendopeptidase [Salinivirgaceae bacterium]|nr:M3 family oligoendopeptidase [Salinivirgaceae bacterium]
MATKLKRNFIDIDLILDSFEDIKSYFYNLLERPLDSPKSVWQWMLDWSELESILNEEMGWRYIRMNCDTSDDHLASRFEKFVTEIEPQISLVTHRLNQKFNTPETQLLVDKSKLFTVIREIRKDLELFREANVPLEAELQLKEQEYGQIVSKMMVWYHDQEFTLPKAANFLKETDRNIRETVYHLIQNRRLQDAGTLQNLLTEQIKIRQQIALNAGFSNYRDYKFKELGRFDYDLTDCRKFHDSVAKVVVPLVEELHKKRKEKLKLETLKPYDLEVDADLLPPLKPYDKVEDLIRKTVFCFRDLTPEFGMFLNEMNKMGYLDLESRKNKAPGGFNYPLHESNIPFIFMNATGSFDDVVTMLHEGGHAIHAYLSAPLELMQFKEVPSEIAELASMTMELITMDEWHHFFDDKEELKRAKRKHLQSLLNTLPSVAKVDKFQHYLYENPNHTPEQRVFYWETLEQEFGSRVVDYSGIENYRSHQWMRYLHIFEVPFYYIEYGFAQLGAIAIWKNFKQDKKAALAQFKNALKMGYTSPIPDVYKAAGIQFNFSEEYIAELMDFVKAELVRLQ